MLWYTIGLSSNDKVHVIFIHIYTEQNCILESSFPSFQVLIAFTILFSVLPAITTGISQSSDQLVARGDTTHHEEYPKGDVRRSL